jgi:hypothetical protein
MLTDALIPEHRPEFYISRKINDDERHSEISIHSEHVGREYNKPSYSLLHYDSKHKNNYGNEQLLMHSIDESTLTNCASRHQNYLWFEMNRNQQLIYDPKEPSPSKDRHFLLQNE